MLSLEHRPGFRAGRAGRGWAGSGFTSIHLKQDGRYASGRSVSTWSESTALPVRLLLRGSPLKKSFSVSESFFHLVGLYLGTHCQGACEADLNWRPVNLACRPLNLAHLVEWLTKHIAVKYSPHISVFYAPTLARRVFNHLPFAFCFLSQKLGIFAISGALWPAPSLRAYFKSLILMSV